MSQDKQNTLILAAKKEFSRVPLHEASIANIIKEAGIPRGSFYQYFEGKEDLYYHLLTKLSQKNADKFIVLIKEENGDLFEAFIGLFYFMVRNRKNQENGNFFRNTFLNMNYKMENTLANNLYEENMRNQHISMFRFINRDNLNISDEQEFQHILKIIISVTFHNLIQVFVKDLTDEEALEDYRAQIELLKKGLGKGVDQ